MKALFREPEAIRYLSIGRNTFLNLKKEGKIVPRKIPGHKITVYTKTELDKFIESLQVCTSTSKSENEKTEEPENIKKTNISLQSSGSPAVMSFQEALEKRPIETPSHGQSGKAPELRKKICNGK